MTKATKKPEGTIKKTKKTERIKTTKKNELTLIRKDMPVSEIIAILPEAGNLLAQYGLHCFSCSQNALETLEEGCNSHGFAGEEIDDLVTDLNELLQNRPSRPQQLTLTKEAALMLKEILTNDGKTGYVLSVGVDEGGGFCMDVLKSPDKDDLTFTHGDVHDVRLAASSLTLSRIGGATVDFREGRFKLDLPEDLQAPKCGCGGGRCGCADKK